jgi:hypothetical protein
MTLSDRALAGTFCAIAGLVVIFAMGAELRSRDLDAILSAGCGAFLGGAVSAGFFGRIDAEGCALAALGAFLATALGASLGGIAYGIWQGPTLIGAIYGPAMVGWAILSQPAIAVAWVLSMTAVNIAMYIVTRGKTLSA